MARREPNWQREIIRRSHQRKIKHAWYAGAVIHMLILRWRGRRGLTIYRCHIEGGWPHYRYSAQPHFHVGHHKVPGGSDIWKGF